MLEEVLKKEIKSIKEGKIDSKRIVSYFNFNNPYAILKPKITVEVELKQGVKASIDISDLFKEELK